MSFYDTIRCLYHDPRYLWAHHGDTILAVVLSACAFAGYALLDWPAIDAGLMN